MALHDELAELRAEVGPHVFADPTTFRAAFDDFVAEGSASTGEVSLLVGAIAAGSLQRLTDQLAIGADPATSIAAQGDLLARDRGTSESSGARWALSVLAYAVGAVPAEVVLPRPPRPDSVSPPEHPAVASSLGSSHETKVVTPDDTTPQPPVSEATRVTSLDPPPPPPPPQAGASATRRRNPLLIGGVVVLLVVAVVVAALMALRDDGGDDGDGGDDPSADASEGGTDAEELSSVAVVEDGITAEVRLVHDGTAASVVLLLEKDGELVEVDRKPVGCPYTDTAFNAGVAYQGDLQLFWGWSYEGDGNGFGQYGAVDLDDEIIEAFDLGDDELCDEGP
ncbi:hypothetical protein [Nocardioides stalactiti]|uniref:hypothetical protein n=1 Tax=Nocardioides stalactiti TaxID=2755356 RepID=UPI001601B023|nr:hypothetical protein [Nocardioides stalactiti]